MEMDVGPPVGTALTCASAPGLAGIATETAYVPAETPERTVVVVPEHVPPFHATEHALSVNFGLLPPEKPTV